MFQKKAATRVRNWTTVGNRASTKPKVSARELAFAVVRDVFGPEARGAQSAFDIRARSANLDARDRSFAAELAYGTIKGRRLIDWYLAPYLAARSKPLPSSIAEILRLGVYQIRMMSGVEPHAAIYETVSLALRHGHRGTAGLVNAILRRFIADTPAEPNRSDFETDDDYLGTKYSLPTWIVAQFRRVFAGDDKALAAGDKMSGDGLEAILAGINAPPQRAIGVNGLRATIDEVAGELESAGVKVRRSELVPEVLLLGDGAIGDDPAGRWSVQSETACVPVDVLDPRLDESVIDLAAGRGNKSIQIAVRMENRGTLVCTELNARKVRMLKQNLARAGVTNAAVVEADARRLIAAEPDNLSSIERDAAESSSSHRRVAEVWALEGGVTEVRPLKGRVTEVPAAHAVLLDAPCSGIGIIGRHPEARWRKSPDDGARLSLLQSELLEAAARVTAPNGRLVYSVCSTDPREGVDVIEAFLASRSEFRRDAFAPRYQPFMTREGDLLTPPGIDGRDGFCVARLTRVCVKC